MHMEDFMLIALIPYFLYTYLKLKKALQMLQQNFYNESNRYLKWSIKYKYKSYITIDLIAILIIFILFIKNNYISYIAFFIIYAVILFVKYHENKNEQIKKPLVFTFRIKR